ncbi:MAG: YwaF family protein, partial [Coriobacteriales bacterium]|nr:YwaF family protein [Coriobacteriales bacterium]
MRIEPFNVIWWGLLACIAVGALLLWLLVGRCSERVRRRVLITISGVNFILFWVYKYWLSQDVSYMQMYGIKGFELWFELPLQLCNINIWLIPLALALKRRSLLAFCFFTGLLGPFMAIVSPAEGFTGDVLMLRNLGFYVTHGLLLIVSISLLTLGFFRPRARDAIWAILLTAALT